MTVAGDEPVEDVFLSAVGRPAPGDRFLAHRERLAPGEVWSVAVGPVEGAAAAGPSRLAERLVAAGLYAAEADSIASIWAEEFFESRTLTVVHRISRATYDRLLPAEIEPAPSAFERVGLVLATDLDPALATAIDGLLGDLGADEYAIRNRAEVEILRVGRPALEALDRAAAAGSDLHVRDRARALAASIRARTGEVVDAGLGELYEDWKRSGRVDPYRAQGAGLRGGG